MKKGFTLIELLIVIAIIAILAGVVIATFPNAQKKAKDSRIISAIAQGRTVMTYICNSDGCDKIDSSTDISPLKEEVTKNGSHLYIHGSDSSSTQACMYAKLNSTKDNKPLYYCADYSGMAGSTTTDPGGAGYCNGTTFVCPSGLE